MNGWQQDSTAQTHLAQTGSPAHRCMRAPHSTSLHRGLHLLTSAHAAGDRMKTDGSIGVHVQAGGYMETLVRVSVQT